MFTLLLATLALSDVPTNTLNFNSSDWIWTSRHHRRHVRWPPERLHNPPLARLSWLRTSSLAATSNMNLFVNGEYVGSGVPPAPVASWESFCVDLLPSFNVFAVNASTAGAGNPGLLAAITPHVFRRHHRHTGHGQLLACAHWDCRLDLRRRPSMTPPGPWPRTSEPPDGSGQMSCRRAAKSLRVGAFRRVFIPAPNQTPMSASILITADDDYTLYVNGVLIGSGSNWRVAQHYTVNFAVGTTEVVFAVLATNLAPSAATTAALIVAAEINMVPTGRTNCTAGSVLVSDALWKSTKGAIPSGFEQPGFDDSMWPAALNQEIYGGSIWGDITIAAPSPPVTV
ncbi:hypothetical protein B0H13DRAFT_1863080 [Mycena leptocephala]|nr:hypothetical protein B0H13DRAFT_1863080 [Mycena leptocephala]